jgi:hypothetical protein
MSVAYVLIYLLPELAESQHEWLEAWPNRPLRWLHRQVYVAAMLGMMLALGINTLTADRRAPSTRFWLNISLAALHNLIVGAVGLRFATPFPLAIAVLAFGSHFVVDDHSLHTRYGRAYARFGRWVLAAALALGAAITTVVEPHVIAIAALLGLLAGGIILSSIKEQLPEQQSGRFLYFVVGAITYAGLLLVMFYLARSN